MTIIILLFALGIVLLAVEVIVPGGIQTQIGLLKQEVDLPFSTAVEIAIRTDLKDGRA